MLSKEVSSISIRIIVLKATSKLRKIAQWTICTQNSAEMAKISKLAEMIVEVAEVAKLAKIIVELSKIPEAVKITENAKIRF